MKLFMLDNYDSFTYNLVQYFEMLGNDVVVRRNDKVTVGEVLDLGADAIILSPGPGRPTTAGILIALIRAIAEKRIPALGVCLGHQGIGEAFGTPVIHAKSIMHGKTSPIEHDGRGLFEGLPQGIEVVRYHSLALDAGHLSPELVVTARTADGEIMGVRHRTLPIEGIQYHPESILTERGMDQLRNFMRIAQACR